MFDRKVTRIITPGTLIDERFIDPYENNFLLAIHAQAPLKSKPSIRDRNGKELEFTDLSASRVGLAWLDLSTGDYFTQGVTVSSLASCVARIGPREVILDEPFRDDPDNILLSSLKDYHHLITYLSPEENDSWKPTSLQTSGDTLAQDNNSEFMSEELLARDILLQYADSRLRGLGLNLPSPVRRPSPEAMLIDKHSLRALEIKVTLRDGHFKGSLLHALRKTVTSSGTRLLNDWLSTFLHLLFPRSSSAVWFFIIILPRMMELGC